MHFQFYVKAKGATAGRNPNIESILVRNFSYEFPDQAPVVLISDYSSGFWQQGQPEDNPKGSEPVPCVEGWKVRVTFDLILNGKNFAGEQMPNARKVSTVYPLILEAVR